MRLKSLVKNKFVWLLAIIVAVITRVTTGYFSEAVNTYAASKIRNYSVGAITASVEEEILSKLENTNFLVEHYDGNGKVSYAYLNSIQLNMVRNNTAIHIAKLIEKINEHNDLEYLEIPLGYFLGGKYLLANGIRIPLELEVIGNQDVKIKADTISEGINTTIINIYLDITLDIQVVIPFQSNKVTSNCTIPLAFEIINNEVPYYLGDLLK